MNTPQKAMRNVLRENGSTVIRIRNKKTGTHSLLELRRGTLTWPSFPKDEPQRTWISEEDWRATVKSVPPAPKKAAARQSRLVLRTTGSTVVWFNNKETRALNLLELRRGDLTWPSFPPSEPQRIWSTEEEWRAAVEAPATVSATAPVEESVIVEPSGDHLQWAVRRGNHSWFFESLEEAEEWVRATKKGTKIQSVLGRACSSEQPVAPVKQSSVYLTLRSGKKVYSH